MSICVTNFYAHSLVDMYKRKQVRKGGKEADYVDAIGISPVRPSCLILMIELSHLTKTQAEELGIGV